MMFLEKWHNLCATGWHGDCTSNNWADGCSARTCSNNCWVETWCPLCSWRERCDKVFCQQWLCIHPRELCCWHSSCWGRAGRSDWCRSCSEGPSRFHPEAQLSLNWLGESWGSNWGGRPQRSQLCSYRLISTVVLSPFLLYLFSPLHCVALICHGVIKVAKEHFHHEFLCSKWFHKIIFQQLPSSSRMLGKTFILETKASFFVLDYIIIGTIS